MIILFTCFIVSCCSQCFTDSTVNYVTTIYYDITALCSNYISNETSNYDEYLYIFKESSTFESNELVIDFYDYPGHVNGETSYFEFGENSYSADNLQIIRVKPKNIYQQKYYTNYINNNTHFYIGCFDETDCETTNVNEFYLYIYSNIYTLFIEEGAISYNYLYYNVDNSGNTNGYPYVFIGSKLNFNLYIRITISQSFHFVYVVSLSGSFYLLTSYNISVPLDYYIDYSTFTTYDSGQFISSSVCSRKDTYRYVMFHQNHTLYTNCSCWPKNNETDIDQSTLFNYPDCNYNSSMFDLILPSSSDTYLLSDDLLEWYSIIFTTSNQTIEINDEKTLTIDELNINKDNISFNGNVNISNLIISTPGASFYVLNFDDITYSLINVDEILFTINSTSTNLESFGLEQIGRNVMIALCIYDGNAYVDRTNNVKSECSLLKIDEENQYNLIINSTAYAVTSDEYWNILSISENSLSINGNSTLTSNICEFENKTITINCNLQCTIININSNTKLIVHGKLIVELIYVNDIIDNLNENGIIELFGEIELSSIEIIDSQTNCFELVSTILTFSTFNIELVDYSMILLSQNHLLRICPSLNTNYEVQCTTIGNTFDYTSFNLLHCPCVDENCTIDVNNTKLDSRNIEFNGIFNILTNSTIAISYDTSLFNIEYEDDKQILLIGNGAVGFETLNTDSLKSETTALSIHSSNQLDCKALLIQYNNQQCIIEDNTNYPQVGDIDNCQLQNGFGCEVCYEGYESDVTNCNECPSNCLRCYNDECINCEMNYQLNEANECELINDPVILFNNNKTMKCNDGYYSNTNQCIKCADDNCITCNSLQCLTCNNSIILNNGTCQLIESNNGEEIISNYGVIDCNDGYYSNNSHCIDCSLTFDNCGLCNINGCLSCNTNGVIINNGSCSLNTNCLNIDYSICLSCNDGNWFNGNECIKCGDNCKNCINGYCIECNDGYILQSDNNCIGNSIPFNCITLSNYGTCLRCSDGYYLNKNLCYECSNECTTCYNLTYCFECNDGYMLNDNNECVDMSESNANCKTAIPGSSGKCAICNDGYYRDQTTCYSCISNCTKCNNGESCLTCESNYFLLNDASECISYDDLTNCETKTQSGCTKCNDNYYLNNQYCKSCSNTTENCNTCNNNGECLTCQNDYILINYECIDYQLIDNCKESSNSKCTSCSFWHTLNSDQTGCDTQAVWWVIVLIGIVILIIFIGICVLIWYITKQLFNYILKKKIDKSITIFDMKTSDIQFNSTNNKDVVINKDEILFNDENEEIGVNEETRDLICVGNASKHTIKVQFSVKDGCDKYEIRTNPQMITIKKGKAVEFEIFIKPLCTCNINDQIMLISVGLSKGKTITTLIKIKAITIITSKLDYDELTEDVKLGEGSFGIVYKGTFRGNQVAIKRLRNANDNERSVEEFKKEVQMLDKFRNDYIVHFYGAVFIPHKICMVTEFAQYGSLKDLMNKRKDKQIDNSIKMKILLDCSKGISYLHSNGILHRDIKPDNFLILSLQNDVQVNAKLTDFGSSRNINMLMTNMTFTKGIGTPVYMAPEMLDKNKYKKAADIYSFAITMYETIIWDEAYDKTRFVYPWDIAKFIIKGSRLQQPTTISDTMYSLIDNCWKQEPKERYSIEVIIEKLEEMNV